MILYIILALVAYLVYTTLIKPVTYWKKTKIFYVSPWNRVTKLFTTSFFEIALSAYNDYPDKRYYGSSQFFKPSLFVRDLDLIKKMTVKDFDHFPDRQNVSGAEADHMLSQNLFSLKGEKWRDMRSTLSPAFTGSKMRSMYVLIQEIAENFTNYFVKEAKDKTVVELELKTSVFTKYTNDVIASCAFGITCDSLKNENNDFFQMGTSFTKFSFATLIRSLTVLFFPKVFQFFRLSIFPQKLSKFFLTIIKDTIALREKENIIRPDMIHLLMEARKGRLKHESDKEEKDTGFAVVQEAETGKTDHKMEITDETITAQAVVFFFAGFDTSATALTFLSYELAVHPDIQSRLQVEIDDALKSGNGKLSYEQLLKMKYLDQVISETLRKYPPGYVLNRVCEKDYKIEAATEDEVDFVVKKGCLIAVPVGGIHMDPKYFPNPEKFDPDRFNDENKGTIVPGSYMPFGSGPRNCIGSRFALLEAKTLIVHLLSKFDIVPIEKTTIPLKLERTLALAIKGGCWLGLKKRTITV